MGRARLTSLDSLSNLPFLTTALSFPGFVPRYFGTLINVCRDNGMLHEPGAVTVSDAS